MELRTSPPPVQQDAPARLTAETQGPKAAPATRLSVKEYKEGKKDGNRKAMAVRVLEKARLSAPADGRVKSEVHQHSAYAPVAQWIEHEPSDLGVTGSYRDITKMTHIRTRAPIYIPKNPDPGFTPGSPPGFGPYSGSTSLAVGHNKNDRTS